MKQLFLKSTTLAPRDSFAVSSDRFVSSSLTYFYSDIDRLFEPTYIPTAQDIVYCRARSVGITETVFNIPKKQLSVVDVGGQKSERRKWIHCFQDVTAILFLVSLSGFDQCLVEDRDAVSPYPRNDRAPN
jgi:guanine nucleotide-binding protein subunit alpha